MFSEDGEQILIFINYTHTFEAFEREGKVHHIHGEVGNQIVLGINPDKNDDVETIDTTFVQFKKYYQRNWYGTDISYLNFQEFLDTSPKSYKKDRTLFVIGHSLDVTDKDIITDLFEGFGKIIILCHSESAKGNYIRNLVHIYGKKNHMHSFAIPQIGIKQFFPYSPLRHFQTAHRR